MTLPRVFAAGGMVTEPELRFSNAGKAWVRLRLACKDRQRGQSGEWEDGPTTFLTVVAFGQTAQNLCDSAAVGDMLAVEGRLQMNEWEDQQGQKRTDYRIVADTIAVALTFNTAKTPKVTGNGAHKPTEAPKKQDDEFPF
jgi:single-strand DNA-binding protein